MHGMVDMVATSSVINKPATFLRNRQFGHERHCLQKAALEARAGDHVHERLILVSKLAIPSTTLEKMKLPMGVRL